MNNDGSGIAEPTETDDYDLNLRVRVPYFPIYSELRHLLQVWPGQQKSQITGLRAKILKLRGTRKSSVDWTDPASWISQRLEGVDRKLAHTIWDRSNGEVNPRHIYGHWLLARRYGLLREDNDGLLQITEVGRNFLETPGGEAEALVDQAEGLFKLLSIVADTGPSLAGGLLEEWADYLRRRSAIRSKSMTKDAMRRRLANLVARGLVERKGNLYSATSDGLRYLRQTEDIRGTTTGNYDQVRTLVRQHATAVRDSLRRQLQEMDPFAFEHLIKRLLEEMDYQNVEVTSPSNDGGVDIVADIEVGITSIREVVQAKRHRRAIQRKDLDALRGSLYRFDAVRGTIFTTSRFSKGTSEAAFATGVAPITLVDGEKLVDLLIEHDIGVRKWTIELLEEDADAFSIIEK